METAQARTPKAADSISVFVYSRNERDSLADAIAKHGHSVIALRRTDQLAERLSGSDARVAVVDARGGDPDAGDAIATLDPVTTAQGRALLVLVARDDSALMAALPALGATHMLLAPFSPVELAVTLALAARVAVRQVRSAHDSEDGRLGWQWSADAGFAASDALADHVGEVSPTLARAAHFYRRLEQNERVAARIAWRRLAEDGQSAFRHQLGGREVIHHLRRDAQGTVHGVIELPDYHARFPGRDENTGLPNQDTLMALIDAPRSRPSDQVSALLLLRFADRADQVQERLPALVRAVSRRISKLLFAESDAPQILARSGAMEFAILAGGGDGARRLRFLAQAIVTAFEMPMTISGGPVLLPVAMSLASRRPEEAAAAMLTRARRALPADGLGDTRWLADADASDAAFAPSDLSISAALAGDEIEVMFQPQFTVAGRRLVGAEALARWRHPREGLLGAASLFAAARREGLVSAVSARIQELALNAMAAWPSALDGLGLSINVAAEDVVLPSFVLRMAAAAGGIDPRRITLELTETALIGMFEEAVPAVADLRGRGFRIALDDFGTGYSGLAYLKAFQVDMLKLDHGMTADLTSGERGRIVARALVQLARMLELEVIAEGVESEAQLALIAGEGITRWQGYLGSSPLSAAAFVAFARNAM